jgi:hypothetical protein
MKNTVVASIGLLLLPFLLPAQNPQQAAPTAPTAPTVLSDSTYADRLGFP